MALLSSCCPTPTLALPLIITPTTTTRIPIILFENVFGFGNVDCGVVVGGVHGGALVVNFEVVWGPWNKTPANKRMVRMGHFLMIIKDLGTVCDVGNEHGMVAVEG